MKIKTKKLTCPGCGADLRYEVGALHCHYCSYKEPLSLAPYALHYKPLQRYTPTLQKKEYSCVSCGAEFASDAASTLCPYCKTALLGEFLESPKPSAIIPFKLTHKEALKRLHEHIKNLWFAPNAFIKEYKQASLLKGYYLPLFIFATKVFVRYSGERGEIYYVQTTRYINGKPRIVQEQRVRWYPASGSLQLDFTDLQEVVVADEVIRRNFSLDATKAFDERFLSGFVSKEYQIDSLLAFERAKAQTLPRIEMAIRADIGGDLQRIHHYTREYFDEKMEYVLAPLYRMEIAWRDKKFRFDIDGVSGKVQGERPYSWVKIFFFALFVASVAAAIFYFVNEYAQ